MNRLLSLLFVVASVSFGQELKPVAAPDLKSPLAAPWEIKHGKWDIAGGAMSVAELPENKHAAVLWHQVPLQSGVVECEFMLDGGKSLLLGCDGDRHIGRIVIQPKEIRVVDDSTEVKGKSAGTVLGKAAIDVKPGTWHKLRYEWSGERMAATLDGVSVEGRSPNLAKKKSRWWFAVSGATVKIRNVTVSGVQG